MNLQQPPSHHVPSKPKNITEYALPIEIQSENERPRSSLPIYLYLPASLVVQVAAVPSHRCCKVPTNMK